MNHTSDLPSLILPLLEGSTRERPCSIAEIQQRLPMYGAEANEREIKAAIESLCLSGHPIGAARGDRHGYYYCRSREDAERAFKPRYRQAVTMLRTVRAAVPKDLWAEWCGQMRLEP